MDYYEESYKYESFMCIAFNNFDSLAKPMLHMSNLQNLMRIENGDDTNSDTLRSAIDIVLDVMAS